MLLRIASGLVSISAALTALLIGIAACSAQTTDSDTTAGRATLNFDSPAPQPLQLSPAPPEETHESGEDSIPQLDFEASDPQQIFNGSTNQNDASSGDAASAVSLEIDGEGERQKLRSTEDDIASYQLSDWHTEPYRDYRSTQSGWTWLPGSGQDFGWLSWQGSPYVKHGQGGGLTTAFSFHMLGGPINVPIPPRLYDFVLGYQRKGSLSDEFSYDIATSVGVYSDFEGSAREGVRFPSHAVGMLHLDHSRDFVFGVDYLDRDDIAILPVIGMSFHEFSVPELRLDLLFPRPKISYLFDSNHSAYLAAYLDGGTWDIEEPGGIENVMTYRDYRLVLGFETDLGEDSVSVWEFGYVFGRELEMRSGYPDTDLSDAFMLRTVWSH